MYYKYTKCSTDNVNIKELIEIVNIDISLFPPIHASTDAAATSLPAITMTDILPADKEKFYRYKGSLTMPGCFESVTWTVFKDSIPISKSQVSLNMPNSRNPECHWITVIIVLTDDWYHGVLKERISIWISKYLPRLCDILSSSHGDFLVFFLQMAKFRLMKSSEKDASGVKQYLVDNYRPVQNLNQRRVSSTFLVGAANNSRV